MKSSKTETRQALLSGAYITILLVNVLVGIMQQSYNSTISLHLDALGYETTIVGAIVSVGIIGSFSCRFFGGKITDRFGRRNTTIAGIIVFMLANLTSGFVTNLPLLFAARIIMMFGYAMASTALAVMVTDITPRARMTEGIGYFGLGNSLSSAIAPGVALALFASAGAFRSVMLFTAVVALGALILSAFFCGYEKKQAFVQRMQNECKATERAPGAKGIWTFLEKKAIPFTLIGLGSTVSVSIITIYLTHYAKQIGIGNAGLFFTASAVCMISARLMTGRLADKRGALICVVPGMLMTILALALLPFLANARWLMYVCGGLYGFGQGMAMPAINSAAVLAAMPERRSAASSTFLLQYDFGYAYGSLMWGALISILSYKTCFVIAAGIGTVTLLMAVSCFVKKEQVNMKEESYGEETTN